MTDYYESDEQLGQYLAFHFGDQYFDVANYPRVCADRCRGLVPETDGLRALDLGCAVGRTTFELARSFSEVTGVDLSRRFIEAAKRLQRQGQIPYQLVDEGDITRSVVADLADSGLDGLQSRVAFEVGDASSLADHISGYDLVFAGNLIDRLHDPVSFLQGIHHRLNVGGYLVISSPYTLLEEFTPRENWVGGFYRDGLPITVLEGLRRYLEPHFEMIGEPEDIPFVIRETARKFQHSIAQLSTWRRMRVMQ